MQYPIPVGIQVSTDNVNWYKLSDHNRNPISVNYELIENTQRMANGQLRKYVVAKKFKITADWKDFPTLDSNLVDYTPGTQTDTSHTTTISYVDVPVTVSGTITSIQQTGSVGIKINTPVTPENWNVGTEIKIVDANGANPITSMGLVEPGIVPGTSFSIIGTFPSNPALYVNGSYSYTQRIWCVPGTISQAHGKDKTITFDTTTPPPVNSKVTVYNAGWQWKGNGIFGSTPEYNGTFTVDSVVPGQSFTVTSPVTVTNTMATPVALQPLKFGQSENTLPKFYYEVNPKIKSIESNGVSVTYYTNTTPLVNTMVDISGATTAGFNGSFIVGAVVPGKSFTVANTATGQSSTAIYSSKTANLLTTLESSTTSGAHGGAWIKAFYETNAFYPIWVKLMFASTDTVDIGTIPSSTTYKDSRQIGIDNEGQTYNAFMTSFTYDVTKRRLGYDYVNLKIEFTEI